MAERPRSGGRDGGKDEGGEDIGLPAFLTGDRD